MCILAEIGDFTSNKRNLAISKGKMMSDIDFGDWSDQDINDTMLEQGKEIEQLQKDKAELEKVVEAAKKYVYDSYEPKAGYDLVRFKRLEEALNNLKKSKHNSIGEDDE